LNSATNGLPFACAAPRLWNKLPQKLRSSQSLLAFKKNLKTFLFTQLDSSCTVVSTRKLVLPGNLTTTVSEMETILFPDQDNVATRD
jgi:hypothetical protein